MIFRFFKLCLYLSFLTLPSVLSASSPESLRVLVIDPGHGGRDPGAVSSGNGQAQPMLEKEVNLEIARDLYQLVHEKLPGLKVVLTRDQDFFVSLGERTKLANQFLNKHAIFMSIHTNSHAQQSRPVKGVEVFYYYNPNSAIENFRMSEYHYRMKELVKEDNSFEMNLQRLVNTKVKEDGKCLAEFVGKGIQMASKEPIRRISPSNLYVVSYGIIPSILVEVGFINNDKLKNKNYLKRLAKGILLGVLEYMAYSQKE